MANKADMFNNDEQYRKKAIDNLPGTIEFEWQNARNVEIISRRF